MEAWNGFSKTNGTDLGATTRYFVGGQEVSAFEMNALTYMAETKKTLDAVLKELRKLNKAKKPRD